VPLDPQSYDLSKNDTLWTISKALYGDPSRCGELARLNGIQDPTTLRTGTALRVAAEGLVRQPGRYVIKKNDTYFLLATNGLGNCTRWPELARLNPVPPTELRTGMEIVVPADFRQP